MATLQESQDEQLLGNQRNMLADKEQLVISLNAELSDILTKERAGKRFDFDAHTHAGAGYPDTTPCSFGPRSSCAADGIV